MFAKCRVRFKLYQHFVIKLFAFFHFKWNSIQSNTSNYIRPTKEANGLKSDWGVDDLIFRIDFYTAFLIELWKIIWSAYPSLAYFKNDCFIHCQKMTMSQQIHLVTYMQKYSIFSYPACAPPTPHASTNHIPISSNTCLHESNWHDISKLKTFSSAVASLLARLYQNSFFLSSLFFQKIAIRWGNIINVFVD